jgi:uncharacterized protein
VPFLRHDEAPTQAERQKMPEHVFGLPDERKYPLDTEKHVHSAASYGSVEHNAGRLSDEKFAELTKNIEAAKKRLGLPTASADSAWETVQRFDLSSGGIATHKETSIGGRVARANLTRTGVLTYQKADGSVSRELRHPDEVFDKDSLATLAHATLTDDHPGKVTPGTWRQESIGHVAGDAEKGEPTSTGEDTVAADLHIQHGPAIEKADAKKLSEVSCGYTCQFDPTPGTWKGQPYDGVQRKIRYNHVALGPPGWGRAGPEVRMHMDGGAGISGVAETGLPSFDRDHGQSHHEGGMTKEEQERLDAALAAEKTAKELAEKLKLDAANAVTAAEKAAKELAVERANSAGVAAELDVLKRQTERPTEDSKLAALKAKEEDERIERTIALRADARQILGDDWKHAGKNEDAIRREVIAKCDPDFVLDGASEDVVRRVYPGIVKHDAKVREQMKQLEQASTPRDDKGNPFVDENGEAPDADKARKAMDKKKRDAWKTPSRKDRERMTDNRSK